MQRDIDPRWLLSLIRSIERMGYQRDTPKEGGAGFYTLPLTIPGPAVILCPTRIRDGVDCTGSFKLLIRPKGPYLTEDSLLGYSGEAAASSYYRAIKRVLRYLKYDYDPLIGGSVPF